MTMPHAHNLMHHHIEALFTHDAEGDLIRVNEPDGPPAPRFFLGRTADGVVLRYRHDVEQGIRTALESAVHDDLRHTPAFDAPLDPSRYAGILGRSAPVQRVAAGPAFCFPEELPPHDGTTPITEANAHLLEAHLTEWIPDVPCRQPMIALVIDSHAVSLCCSVRLTTRAHEAGVETAPACRGRGLAGRAAAAWARAVRAENREPLYSTSWTNTASRAVARKLGLVLFGSDLHLT